MSDAPTEPADEAPKEKQVRVCGTKLFQITEADLAELERLIPRLIDNIYSTPWYNERRDIRVNIRRVKAILSDVRWDYGPFGDVTIIPAG
jgi:hypothetical protein